MSEGYRGAVSQPLGHSGQGKGLGEIAFATSPQVMPEPGPGFQAGPANDLGEGRS